MNADTDSFRDDLAFMRALIERGEGDYRSLGEGYLAAGLCYGGQIVLNVVQGAGLIPHLGPVDLAIGIGPTVIFLVALMMILRANRATMYERGAFISRAIGAMFGAIGLSNVALMAVFGSVAWRESSLTIWLIYPCTVFVLQGAAWLAAFMLRRRGWHGLIALGWFICGIGMALSIKRIDLFLLFAALGLFGCMALPGWLILRQQREAA